MKIAGKDYQFMLTVKARRELRALCPGGDITKLDEFLDGPEGEEHFTQMALLLSRAHEEYRAYWDTQEGKTYDPCPLQEDVVEFLSMEDYRTLQEEVMESMRRGMGITVETEEPKEKGKGKKKEEEKQS